MEQNTIADEFEVGAHVEVKDDEGGEPWGATITSVGEKTYEINYDGYEDDKCKWISRNMIVGRIVFKVGSHVEIRDDEDGEPWGAVITNIGEKVYEINYDGYEEDNREWVSRDKVLGLV